MGGYTSPRSVLLCKRMAGCKRRRGLRAGDKRVSSSSSSKRRRTRGGTGSGRRGCYLGDTQTLTGKGSEGTKAIPRSAVTCGAARYVATSLRAGSASQMPVVVVGDTPAQMEAGRKNLLDDAVRDGARHRILVEDREVAAVGQRRDRGVALQRQRRREHEQHEEGQQRTGLAGETSGRAAPSLAG